MRHVCALLLLCAIPASAEATAITVLDTSYMVTLSWTPWNGAASTRTTVDGLPSSDELLVEATGRDFVEGAIATADTFAVSTWTQTYGRSLGEESLQSTSAYATTILTFAPLVSETASIAVMFPRFQDWTETIVRLTDLTTATELWAVGWGWRTLPAWGSGLSAPLAIASDLDAAHVYQLSLFAHSNASGDTQQLTTRIDGLAVPEPSTLILLGLGLAVTCRRLSSSQQATTEQQ